jgi:hypothetical protein
MHQLTVNDINSHKYGQHREAQSMAESSGYTKAGTILLSVLFQRVITLPGCRTFNRPLKWSRKTLTDTLPA